MSSLQDVIELNYIKMWSYCVRVSPNPVTCAFIKERGGRFGHRDTGAYREEGGVATETEVRVMCTRRCPAFPATNYQKLEKTKK